MCSAYRQRSSWARIKLSSKIYSNSFRCFKFYLVALFIHSLLCVSIWKQFSLLRNLKVFWFVFSRFYGTILFSMTCRRFKRQLLYYISSLCSCQELFWSFLNFFFEDFQKSFSANCAETRLFTCFRAVKLLLSLATTICILANLKWSVKNFFQKKFASFWSALNALNQKAFLFYCFMFDLSSIF